MKLPISRRTALKGLGTAISLPFFESLGVAAPVASGVPKRLGFVYVPNGVNMPLWTPKAEGKLAELTGTLAPLDPFKSHVNVLSGLVCDKARANGDGSGDHARAMASFLTGRQARKTHGADIKVGISADQHVANTVGQHTRFPSLELGVERAAAAATATAGTRARTRTTCRGAASPPPTRR